MKQKWAGYENKARIYAAGVSSRVGGIVDFYYLGDGWTPRNSLQGGYIVKTSSMLAHRSRSTTDLSNLAWDGS